jgi:hypothetical protein
VGIASRGPVERLGRFSFSVRPHGVPDRGVVLDRCNPPGSVVDAGLDAAARALRAERTADGSVLYVQHALHVSPRAPPINAQRVARFYHCRTHNYLPPKKLRQDIQ